jgi:hypothetical protein
MTSANCAYRSQVNGLRELLCDEHRTYGGGVWAAMQLTCRSVMPVELAPIIWRGSTNVCVGSTTAVRLADCSFRSTFSCGHRGEQVTGRDGPIPTQARRTKSRRTISETFHELRRSPAKQRGHFDRLGSGSQAKRSTSTRFTKARFRRSGVQIVLLSRAEARLSAQGAREPPLVPR